MAISGRVLAYTGLLAVVAGLDYATHSAIQFSVFYFLPIALTAWHIGPRPAVAAALICSIVWWALDAASGRVYPTELIAAVNYTLRVAAFTVIAVVVSRLRQARDRERQLNDELQATIAELRSSSAEIDALRSEIQSVCAWTSRIQSEGKWMPLDKFLADKLHFKITHGISEEAADRLRGKSSDGGSDSGSLRRSA